MECLEQLEYLRSDNFVIVSDFNIPSFNSADASDSKCRTMRNFLHFLYADQYNNVVNLQGRTLDLILSSCLCHVEHDDFALIKEDVYHPALDFTLQLTYKSSAIFPINASCKVYNFAKANLSQLYHDLLNVNWNFLNECSDVNVACSNCYSVLYSIFDIHVPKFRSSKKLSYPPWFTTEIIQNLKLKNYFFNKYKNSKSNFAYAEFKRLRSKIKMMSSISYKNYVSSIEYSISKDPKRFWSYFHNKRGTSRIPGKMFLNDCTFNTPQSIVNAFKDYFCSVYAPLGEHLPSCTPNVSNMPIINITSISTEEIMSSMSKLKSKMTTGPDQIPSCLVKEFSDAFIYPLLIIFNLSLKTSAFPNCWKEARICPVFKNDDPTIICNYRPISILSNFAKILETILYSRIYPQIRNYISPDQHGFMENRSTISNLSCFTQFASKVLDNQGQVDVIYIY
ncbi:uncharacterized protein LOC116175664 [Photinus pyralis]|uniref:uncharacterized protein LOC116175664 n=1 Tax=Photinus pyralis TaxID=7054 RepID=UPI00126749EF|nr:uncharacterized protein LOC116175664 [Photinus pyralis]